MKVYISAQAQQQRDIASHVQSQALVVIDHLLKLVIMPHNDARNHWQGEIAGHLKTVQKLKRTNKPPSEDLLFKWMFTDNGDYISDIRLIRTAVEDCITDYDFEYTGDINFLRNRFIRVCQGYFVWLSQQLSEHQFISSRTIYNKLDELV